MIQIRDELRKRQLAITGDFKSRAEKAEKILGEIEACETKLSSLNDALSAVLGIGVITAAAAAKVPKVKVAKVKSAKVKAVEITTVKPAVNPTAGMSLKDSVRDFLDKAGKPMKIAEIVQSMQQAGHVFKASKPVLAMRFLIYNNKKMFKKVKPGTFAVMAAKVPEAKAVKVIKVSKTAKAKPAAVKSVANKVEAPTLKDSVREFMLKAGKPMKIAEIVKAMQKAGHVFESKKPVPAMSKLMYNHAKVFKRVKPGTFKAV